MKLANPFNSPRAQKIKDRLLTTVTGVLVLGVLGNYLAEFIKSGFGAGLNTMLHIFTFTFRGYVERIHHDIGEARSDQFVRTIYTLLFTSVVFTVCVMIIRVLTNINKGHRLVEGIMLKAQRLATLTADIEALEGEIASVKAKGDKEKLEKKLDTLKKEKEDFLARENKEKNIHEYVEEGENAINKVKKSKRTLYSLAAFILLCLIYFSAMFVGDLYTRDAGLFVERSIEILTPNIPPEKVLQLRSKYRSVDSAQKFYDLHDELQAIAKEKNIPLPAFTVIKR